MLCPKSEECDTNIDDQDQMALSRLHSELKEAERRRDEAIALAEQVFSQESIRIHAAIEAHALHNSSLAAAAPAEHRNDDIATDCQICFGEKVDKGAHRFDNYLFPSVEALHALHVLVVPVAAAEHGTAGRLPVGSDRHRIRRLSLSINN